MTKTHDDQESDHPQTTRTTGLHTIRSPHDDPQTRPAVDLEVGLAEREVPEDS